MGTNLREYKRKEKKRKLADGKGVGGLGRLTDKKVDQMQNYYGQAIRGNKGSLSGMKNAVMAIFKHMIKDDHKSLGSQHSLCPKDVNPWCKFWKNKADTSIQYDATNRLPSVFQEELRPIFERLSSNQLLERCLKGLTQNQNECFNSTLWSLCSKTVFCGKRKVSAAVAQAVGVFNTGNSSKASSMVLCGIEPGMTAVIGFKKSDHSRIVSASRKISHKYRNRRRELRQLKKSKKEKVGHFPGAFSLSAEPDVDVLQLKKSRGKTANKSVARSRGKDALLRPLKLQRKQKQKDQESKVIDEDQDKEAMAKMEPNILFRMPVEEILTIPTLL